MAKVDPPDQVTTIEEFHERLPRRWPRLIVYLLLALLIAILLVFGVRTIYRHFHKAAIKVVPASTKRSFSTQSSNSASSSGAATKSNTPSTSGTSLPNSGPGDVAGLFAATSLAAAGLHFVVSMRRSVKTN